jgi:hypothetical protein
MSFFGLSSVPPLGLGMNEEEVEVIRNPYCSISDVEEFVHRHDFDLGRNVEEDYDRLVGKAIRRAEREIDSLTMSTFHQVHRREFHSGTLEQQILTDCYPIIRVEKIEIYSAGLQKLAEYDGANAVVVKEAGAVGFPALYYNTTSIAAPPYSATGFVFLPGNHNVKIDYWYGWPNGVPDHGYHAGIRDAAAMLAAANLLEEADSRVSQGLVSLNVQGQGSQYGKWERRADKLRARAMPLIKRYRRILIEGMPY